LVWHTDNDAARTDLELVDKVRVDLQGVLELRGERGLSGEAVVGGKDGDLSAVLLLGHGQEHVVHLEEGERVERDVGAALQQKIN